MLLIFRKRSSDYQNMIGFTLFLATPNQAVQVTGKNGFVACCI